MNCRYVSQRLSAYLDRELSGQEMMEVRDHLRTCSACDRELRQLSEVRRLLRSQASTTGATPPPGLESKIKSHVFAQAQPAPMVRPVWQWVGTGAVALSILGLFWQIKHDASPEVIAEEAIVVDDPFFDTEIYLQAPDSVTGMSPMMPAAYQR